MLRRLPAEVQCPISLHDALSDLLKPRFFKRAYRSQILRAYKRIYFRDRGRAKHFPDCGINQHATISGAAEVASDAHVNVGHSAALLIEPYLTKGPSLLIFPDQDDAFRIRQSCPEPLRVFFPADLPLRERGG